MRLWLQANIHVAARLRVNILTLRRPREKLKNHARPFCVVHISSQKHKIPNKQTLLQFNVVSHEVPFEMTLEFSYSPGQAIANPSDVIFLDDKGLAFPVVLTKVELKSISASASKNKADIDGVLIAKYGSKDSSFADGLKTVGIATVSDEKNRSVHIESQDYLYLITYSSNFEKSALDKAYTDHLADLEKNKIESKPDASSGL